MKGNPKHLNSRADYLYIKENCEPEFWKPLWQNMLDMRFYWAPTDVFNKEEKCVTDSIHRYEKIEPSSPEEAVRYQQYELLENPHCDMIKFGFTEEEIKKALAES